jgi:general secretion pathway protein A
MYNQFFGFAERPFRLVPDPAYLFLSAHHEEALAHLKYAVSEGEGFVEITGEVGTGKTLLCRTFLEQLDDDVESAYIFNPRLSALELIKAVNDEFGVQTKDGGGIKDHIDALNMFLMQKKAEGKKVVLVIDEAQNLDIDVLEQVRLLSNLETTRSKLLQIILAGQPELGEKLDSHQLRQLGQRITLSCRLRPLTPKETGDYIRHRIQVASRKTVDIFTRRAVKKIYHYSGGIPRLINIACDRALLCAYGFNQHKVAAAIADAAIAELASRGERHRRRAGAFSPGWGRRLGLLSVLAGLVVVFFFQSDIRALLAGWTASVQPAGQIEPAASNNNIGPLPPPVRQARTAAIEDRPDGAATVSQESAIHEEISDNREISELSRHIASVDHQLPEHETGAAETVDNALVSTASEKDGRRIVDVEVSETVVATPDVGALDVAALDFLVPKDAPLTVAGDVVPFADYLKAVAADGSRDRALQAVLTGWGINAPAGTDIDQIADDAAFFAAAAAVNGLSVQRVAADPDLIRGLDLCAVLAFDGPTDQGPIYLAAVGADDNAMALDDGVSGIRIMIPDEEILRQEPNDAYVFWKNFYNYQGVIPFSAPDEAVVTLKLHLRELGHAQIAINPVYDSAARRVVERLQAKHGIPVDGFVGPLTLMALYNETPGLAAPRLRESESGKLRLSGANDNNTLKSQ